MSELYVLFEHAAGYAIFRVKEFEEVGMLLPQVEASVTDLSRFNQVVKLISFAPFKTASSALENINGISEGLLPEDLRLVLETHLPRKKKSIVTLGVSEPKLGAAITEALGITCQHTAPIPEIVRGIRYHFHGLVKGFTAKTAGVAQLGLGHSYSRAKVKFNVHRSDNMIIQSIALLDQLDKDVNTFSMRIREWYSYHFPELVKIVPENYMYARVARLIGNRKAFTEDKLEELEELVMDSGKAQAILSASRSSMGMDISPVDLLNIELFAARVVALSDYRKDLANYLHTKMESVAPNLATLVGDQVGARLISHAGSLTNLAKFPASTVQILGAEKALFRALKTRGNTPKYGLLFHSTFIGRAGLKNKGRISRYLANKCSIASRIDCFSEKPTNIFGEKLKQQVEERLTFYESGELPRKNIEVMQEAMQEVAQLQAAAASSAKKKKKKDKKRKSECLDESVANDESGADSKTKKKRKSECLDESVALDESGANDISVENGDISGEPPKKKKKKKMKLQQEVE